MRRLRIVAENDRIARVEVADLPHRGPVDQPDMLCGVIGWTVSGGADGEPQTVTLTLRAGQVEFDGLGIEGRRR